MWTWISVGVMAIVARMLWTRLGRLEFQVGHLKATIKKLQAEHAGAMDSTPSSSNGESRVPDAQPSLPFDTPRKPAAEPTQPAESSLAPRQLVADPPASVTPPVDAEHQIRPSLPLEAAQKAVSEPVPPVETTEIPQLPPPRKPVDAAPRISTEPPPPTEKAAARPPAALGSAIGDKSALQPRHSGSVPVVARNAAPRPPTPAAPTAAKTKARRASTAFQDKARALWRKRPSLERVFGARLAVWMGGAALAMAGYFLVAYSIELGLVTPTVRMAFGGAFGLLLLAGAEAIHRRPNLANGRRIAQAMAGAGIADLYVMLYIATTVFDLLSPTVGFLGLAATTAIALVLALRLGPPTAVMGLIGGFATPALAGASEPNIPVLLGYLFLVIGGLHLLIRNRGWWWLGIPATLGGFGWVGLLLTTEIAAEHSTSLGLFLVAISGLAFLSGGHRKSMPLGQVLRDARTLTPLITGGIALAQLAVVVGVAEFGWLDWGLFGLLAAGCIAIGLYDENTAILPPIALIVSIGLLGLSPAQSSVQFSVVAGVAFALFAGAGYWQTWRGRRPLLWLGQAVVASLGIYGIAYVKLHDAPYEFGADPIWAGIALLLAAPAAATAYVLLTRRGESDRSDDRPALVAGGTASALIATTLVLAVPGALLPLAVALQAAATALIARRLRADFINWYNIAVGALFVVALMAVPTATPLDALWRLFAANGSEPAAASLVDTVWVYLLPAVAMAAIARLSTVAAHRSAGGWAATLLIAAGIAASVPGAQLPLAYALQGLAVVALATRLRIDALNWHALPLGTLLVIALLAVPIATPPDALWRLFGANGSEPEAASLIDTLWVYLLPALAITAIARLSTMSAHRMAAGWAATVLVAIGLAASVPGAQLPLAYALQGLIVMALANRLHVDTLNRHAIPLGMLLSTALMAVPTATPLDALLRLFMANGSEPAAASLIDTLWVYLLPAAAIAAAARLSTVPAYRIAAGWAVTILVAFGLAVSVPGAQLPLAYALQGLVVVALARRLRAEMLNIYALPLGMLLAIALMAVPTATPLDALIRLFTESGAGPAAASLIDTAWVYLLPAMSLATIAWLSTVPAHRIAAGWAATFMVAIGLAASVPGTQLPLAYALQGLAMVVLGARLRSDLPNLHTIALGILFAIALIAVPESVPWHAFLHLLAPDAYVGVTVGFDAVLWIFVLPALAAVAAARLTASATQRPILAGVAAGLVTLALSAALPADWLPLAIGVEALLLALLASRHEGYGLYQLSIATVLIYLVQIVPVVFQIAAGTLPSLVGTPVLAGDLPGLAEFLRRVALPAIPIATMVAWLPGERLDIVRRSVGAIGAIVALLLAYIAVKALFGIDDGMAFQSRGFFERAVMTQLIFGAGALAFWLSRRERFQALKAVGLSFTLVALARLVWFDLGVFNPMFLAQEVGALPLLNGLLIAYGLPIPWLMLRGRAPGPMSGSWVIAGKAAILALVTILVGYQVRQFFQGSLLIGGPVGTAELYGYSAAALATGTGFLVWGTAREDRLVRLVSLALMLTAVGKVFLYDASELTGLWRIAAFAGLGFSLLGISWFYTKYVFADRDKADNAAAANDLSG